MLEAIPDSKTTVTSTERVYKLRKESMRVDVSVTGGTRKTETTLKRHLFDTHSGNIDIQQITYTDAGAGMVSVVYRAFDRQALDTIRTLILERSIKAAIAISAEMDCGDGTLYYGGLSVKPNGKVTYRDRRLTVDYHVVNALLVPIQ